MFCGMKGKNMPKVSIIMPVYNEEAFLKETLDSVISQTLKDIEIICVDDGSTDNSVRILQEYAKNDKRILVLQQKNSGAGTARNFGMTRATGEYLAFLDSDDLYEPAMLEEMYTSARQDDLDVIVCRADAFDSKTGRHKETRWTVKTQYLPSVKPFAATDVPDNFFATFVWWPWDKLFKKTFVDELGIVFQNLRTSNDLFFVAAATLKAKRISYVDKVLAHHRVGLKSSLSVTRENSWDCFYHALTAVKQFLREQRLYERFEADFINYALHFSLWHLNTIHGNTYSLLYNALKNKWFEEFDILGHTEDFFYNKTEFRQFNEIMEMDLDTYLCKRIDSLEQDRLNKAKEIRRLKKKLSDVQNSLSFRAGRILTFLPRKLRDLFR